jgi:KaiC/GvpD/RAD55 family RecA-like ATPase
MMGFLSTRIGKLDVLLNGGLAKGSTTLLIGPAGTLKSYICQQFMYAGLKGGERCLYVGTLESQSDFEDQLKLNFGWDIKPLAKKRLLKFVDLSRFWAFEPSQLTRPVDLAGIAETVFKAVVEVGGGRMCVNTLTHLFNFTADAQTVVRLILGLRNNARKNGLTALFIMDEGAQEKHFEENVKSICDYVLTTCIKNNERRIRVSKAATKHGLEWHRLFLTSNGVEVEVIL